MFIAVCGNINGAGENDAGKSIEWIYGLYLSTQICCESDIIKDGMRGI
jgi:hypothetical protein